MAHDVFKCSQSQGAMQPTSRVAQRAWLWSADAQTELRRRARDAITHQGFMQAEHTPRSEWAVRSAMWDR